MKCRAQSTLQGSPFPVCLNFKRDCCAGGKREFLTIGILILAVRVYNNILSPDIKSPPSPMNYSDGFARGSSEHSVVPNVLPRLSSIEAQSALYATEIGLLKTSTSDILEWRSRIDADIEHTSKTLFSVDKEICSMRKQLGSERSLLDVSMADFTAKLDSYASELEYLKASESVTGQLEHVESRLRQVEMILVEKSEFESVLADIKTETSETQVMTRAAVKNIEHVTDRMATVQDDLNSLASKVETINLALEVVEQSLEDFDESETIESLRSRMDDLDVGIENVSQNSDRQIQTLAKQVEELKQYFESNIKESERRSKETYEKITLNMSNLKTEVRNSRVGSPSVSGASSPATMATRSSDARVKAAVHTLSDGYRSLHKAMGLMYEEQADIAKRVKCAGVMAQNGPLQKSVGERIRASVSDEKVTISSYPITLEDNDDMAGSTDVNQADLAPLLSANLMDSMKAERRVEALEQEVAALRQILSSLCFVPGMGACTHKKLSMNMTWSDAEQKFKVDLDPSLWKISSKA